MDNAAPVRYNGALLDHQRACGEVGEMSPTEDRPQSLPEQLDDSLPEKIGRYVILERLGAGGMGTVYKARDPQLDRVVALKLPRFDVPQRDRVVRMQRFQREARAAAQIWHPHVCPIYDVGEHDGRPYVVMAYVDGQSLAERLAVHGRYENITEAVGVIRQILDALEAVHAHGIVHRDLKPGNILIDSAGRAILSDFGLARPEYDREPLTSDGTLVGTPAYMAPEQASGESERIGPWTDLYSLGVVIYEMLTGRLPFTGAAAVVLAHILRDEPPSPRAIRPDLDLTLEAIVLRALRKIPSERYTDAPAFRATLDGWNATRPPAPALPATIAVAVPTAPEQGPTPLPSAPPQPPSLARRLGWLGGGILLTVSMGLLACIPLLLIVGEFGRTIPFGIFALTAFLAGWALWSLHEGTRAPKGLQTAAQVGSVYQVKRAIANGVPLDSVNDMGETALMSAASAGHTEIVKLLMLHGASIVLRNTFGQTAADLARAKHHDDIVTLFEKGDPTIRRRAFSRGTGVPSPLGRGLLAAALLGAILAVCLYWWIEPWPKGISYAEFEQMLETRQVSRLDVLIVEDKQWIEFIQYNRLHYGHPGERFLTIPPSTDTNFIKNLHDRHPNLRINAISTLVGYAPHPAPGEWVVVPMLAFPLAIAFLLKHLLGPWPIKRA
jgi:tRNA A-37 threonylcarbamoyl transferase component Bud32